MSITRSRWCMFWSEVSNGSAAPSLPFWWTSSSPNQFQLQDTSRHVGRSGWIFTDELQLVDWWVTACPSIRQGSSFSCDQVTTCLEICLWIPQLLCNWFDFWLWMMTEHGARGIGGAVLSTYVKRKREGKRGSRTAADVQKVQTFSSFPQWIASVQFSGRCPGLNSLWLRAD